MALFDIEKGNVTICRAGHNPILYHKSGETKSLPGKGLGIGVGSFEQFEISLEEVVLSLEKGDIYVFYSDGLTEAMNKAKEMYGLDRISKIIQRNIYKSSDDLKNDILSSIEKFREDAIQHDDETIVVIKYASK